MLLPNFRVKKLTTGKAFASHAILEAEKTAAYQRGGRAEMPSQNHLMNDGCWNRQLKAARSAQRKRGF
ncbi:hypothetical protein FND55_03565 [Lactobacillus paracasei subsp. paracasei]|nr:hypothetical protein DMC16_10290 [Lacticaseibacillus paracasei]MBG1272720.1 hypothetical protein [Lacticaseibacillus paracasei subsp. paracasei]AYG23898.1 hypothetical protein CFM84_12765 [Lacticaseibacillus paracasei]MCT3350675.1 hypothetical protein [Lacticaseibacillus paracasei]OSP84854.1 hypothetical protein B9J76_05945 [Lacticaseibacillus paracasei]